MGSNPYGSLDEGGTNGLSFTVHTALVDDDGNYDTWNEWDNVVDIMRLPGGTTKFIFENGEKAIAGSQIVRATVQGLDEAVRYRCFDCHDSGSDVIAAESRGDTTEMYCPLCDDTTEFEAREIDDV